MPEEKATSSKNVWVLWLGFMFILLLSKPAFANSSWRWLTRSPRQVLVVAVVLTLLVETWAVVSYGKVTKKTKPSTNVPAYKWWLSRCLGQRF